MKKSYFIYLLILLISSQICFAQGKIETAVNKGISTDIKAYINGYEIRAMNINGHTGIIVEQLRNYGFDVIWSPTNRSLEIKENLSKKIQPIEISTNNNVGKKVINALSTDIKTYINDRKIESFNIDGYTVIFIEELEEFGEIVWNEEKREIRFESNKANYRKKDENNNCCFVVNCTDEIDMILSKKENDYYYEGKKVGFVDKSNIMISGKAVAKRLGYDVIVNNGCYTFKKGNYSFKLKNNSKNIEKFFDGYLYESYNWTEKQVFKDDDIYFYDNYLPFVFGISKDNRGDFIKLIYKEFDVKDYGNYDIQGSRFLIDYSNDGHDVNMNISNNTHTFKEDYCRIPKGIYLEYGDNELEITITHNDRILMLKKINIQPNLKTNEIIYNEAIGLKMKTPQKGYIQTDKSKILIDGEISHAYANNLVVKIEKLNMKTNKFEKIGVQNLEIKDKNFNDYVNLNKGYGMYRIKAFTDINLENNKFEVFELFINYK